MDGCWRPEADLRVTTSKQTFAHKITVDVVELYRTYSHSTNVFHQADSLRSALNPYERTLRYKSTMAGSSVWKF